MMLVHQREKIRELEPLKVNNLNILTSLRMSWQLSVLLSKDFLLLRDNSFKQGVEWFSHTGNVKIKLPRKYNNF